MKKLWAVVALVLPLITGVALGVDFDGDSRDDIAIFRPTNGLWAIRGVTRSYFGGLSDTTAAGDYNGDGVAEIGIFRESSGLWAIKGVTRCYFGGSSDTAITGGGSGQRTYDYVVKAGDGSDLVQALESNLYRSVFIPNGIYQISEIITVDNVARVTGASMGYTVIMFSDDGYYLDVNQDCCLLEDFSIGGGGSTSEDVGALHIRSVMVEVRKVRSFSSSNHGFSYTGDAGSDISFLQARASRAASTGFYGDIDVESTLTNCRAVNCATGFSNCRNLSSCVVRWEDLLGGSPGPISARPGVRAEIQTDYGFHLCDGLSSCRAVHCNTAGFSMCRYVSASSVDGAGSGTNGFIDCDNLSSCHVVNTTGVEYNNCNLVDAGSCD